jgi:ERCC4-type nuclease
VHTCQTIEYLARWWGKEWKSHRGHLQMHKPGPPQASLQLKKASLVRRVAVELPHVGWKRAQAVEEAFGTVEDMVVATEDEWREVEGIGRVSAREIYKFIHRGE